MRLKSMIWYIQRPRAAMDRIHYAIHQMLHPDEPWISPQAVQFCMTMLGNQMVGLEWGSGRSTVWFGRRLQKLVSVEHDPSWYATVSSKLREESLFNVDYRYVPLDHDVRLPTYAKYPEIPKYVRVAQEFGDDSLDFVVVDGHYRQACILAALPKLKPGGYLLVDNSNWLPLKKWGVPQDWDIAHQSGNALGETTIWRKPFSNS